MADESKLPAPDVARNIEATIAVPADFLATQGGVSLAGLVKRAAQRDQAAFRQLYDLTCGMVNAIALRVLGSREDAEEVVHDVYLKAWRNASSYDESRGSPMAWLLMMARSMSIDRLRQRGSRPQPVDDIAAFDHLTALGANPEEHAADEQRRAFVQRAFGELSAEQQEVLRLAFYSGLSHSELAERLGQPLGTVKTRIRLGLMHMKRALDQRAQQEH